MNKEHDKKRNRRYRLCMNRWLFYGVGILTVMLLFLIKQINWIMFVVFLISTIISIIGIEGERRAKQWLVQGIFFSIAFVGASIALSIVAVSIFPQVSSCPAA